MFHVKHSPLFYMATIVVYYDCPYDEVNIPVFARFLDSDAKHTEELSIGELNNITDAHLVVRVNISKEVASSAKYAKVSYEKTDGTFTGYYHITDRTPLNKNVWRLQLTIEPLITYKTYYSPGANSDPIEGANPNFKLTGRLERCTGYHFMGSNLSNTSLLLEEPWTPGNEREKTVVANGFPQYKTITSVPLIACTVDLSDIPEVADSIKVTYNSEGQIDKYERKPTAVKTAPITTFALTIAGSSSPVSSYNAPYGVYSAHAPALGTLNALGLNSAVIDSWEVPGIYIKTTERPSSAEIGNRGFSTISNDSEGNQSIDVVIDNQKKTKTSLGDIQLRHPKTFLQYAVIHIYSRLGGGEKSFRAIDVGTFNSATNQLTASFSTFADPSPNGCPYIRPKYFMGVDDYGLSDFVMLRGAHWNKPGLTYEGRSGQLITDQNNAVALQNAKFNQTTTRINNGFGVARDLANVISNAAQGDIGDLINSGVSAVQDVISVDRQAKMYESQKAQMENTADLNKAVYQPAYSPDAFPELGNYLQNNFVIVVENLDATDMLAFDQFLNTYGEASNDTLNNEPLIINHYIEDAKLYPYSYIKFAQVDAIPNDLTINPECTTVLETELLRGVRIWNTAGAINSRYSVGDKY